jgi:hypothetical protein
MPVYPGALLFADDTSGANWPIKRYSSFCR